MKLTIGLMIAFLGGCLFKLTVLSDRDKELMGLESAGIQRELANDLLLAALDGQEVKVSEKVLDSASAPIVAAYQEKMDE
jgi:hypothetical protein